LLHDGARGTTREASEIAAHASAGSRDPFLAQNQESETMDRLIVLMLWLVATAPLVAAEQPRISFDMPYAIACRDVTPSDYSGSHPGCKLMEAKLEISSLLTAGQEKDLTEYFIRIESPQRTLTIADYLPKTKHEAIASSMTKEQGSERVVALGINLSEKYELLTVPGPSAGIGTKKTSSVKTELLPPLETVAASGTLERASVVFFKIKSTPRNLLEGTREYALVLRVPAVWRADYLRVHCEAEGIRRNMISTFDEEMRCGQRDFVVALYQDGDEEARKIAENFARREAAKLVQSPKSKAQGSASATRWPHESSPWAAVQR
jgi:hypothetical protein